MLIEFNWSRNAFRSLQFRYFSCQSRKVCDQLLDVKVIHAWNGDIITSLGLFYRESSFSCYQLSGEELWELYLFEFCVSQLFYGSLKNSVRFDSKPWTFAPFVIIALNQFATQTKHRNFSRQNAYHAYLLSPTKHKINRQIINFNYYKKAPYSFIVSSQFSPYSIMCATLIFFLLSLHSAVAANAWKN